MFGARAYADNFDEEGLKEAIHFAHMRNVHVHVTVNTIVDDNELPGLKQYLRFLYEAGADAVLVQDLGAARIVRSCARASYACQYPDDSTQSGRSTGIGGSGL